MLEEWAPTAALYLHHGKRYCVSVADDGDPDVCLFDADNDAFDDKHDHHYEHFEKHVTLDGAIEDLKAIMGTTGITQYPVKILKPKYTTF